MDRLILASGSPRRSELLRNAGIPFETDTPSVEEVSLASVADSVVRNALLKAEAAAGSHPGCFILAADTLVSLDGQKFGKPRNEEDAFRMIRSLTGKTHQVYSGVAVISPDRQVFSGYDCSEVTFDRLSDKEILSYIRSGEPYDKAGAYAIQGRAGLWVKRLEGCPSSVIGLPLALVRSLLGLAGFRFEDFT